MFDSFVNSFSLLLFLFLCMAEEPQGELYNKVCTYDFIHIFTQN